MIYDLSDSQIPAGIGKKAAYLMRLKQAGFCVPEGFVLGTDVFDASIRSADDFALPEAVVSEITARILPDRKYAVRSSATKEDLDSFSFAGQYETTLNVCGAAAIAEAVVACYRSLYSETARAYLTDADMKARASGKDIGVDDGADDLKMAVVIQEMVDADVSGVAFTVNPRTGCDREIVVEAVSGLGEDLVSGRVMPVRVRYNWYADRYEERPEASDGWSPADSSESLRTERFLTAELLAEMMTVFHEIMIHFGYPVDVEFAVKDGKLYILQARPITKILYASIPDQWTTADFKDGGVSATVCRPFMWSLYEYVWEIAYRAFLHRSVLVPSRKLGKLGDLFFGRPYWNLTMAKRGMANVPGYKEREFDNELGVRITYAGDGVTTALTPISALKALRIFLTHRRQTWQRLQNNEAYRAELLGVYEAFYREITVGDLASPDQADSIAEKWLELIFDKYLTSERTYFEQIFINTVGQSIYKDDLTKHISESDYLELLSGLSDISHLRPFANLWEISRKIRADAAALRFWKQTPAEKIASLYASFCEAGAADADIYMDTSGDPDSNAIRGTGYGFSLLRAYLSSFGYHSDKELDVAYPHYAEDVRPVILSLKGTVLLGDEHSPMDEAARQATRFQNTLSALKRHVSAAKYGKLERKIDEMRRMLWWREEFRDISTRFYFLIRLYSLELASEYVREGVLASADDFWFLKIEDIRAFIAGELDRDTLASIVSKNRKYYLSFRNFTSENEIGSVFDKAAATTKSSGLKGVGCSGGIVTGRARVILSFEEIDRIEPGDILITRFTDTGWTAKFAILNGIVTEYGGLLCHAAIVSREYGIPCVVCVADATKKIEDGCKIRIDGSTGTIETL
ncbi:MAG: phosphoenolpyruvate synthase [Clostridiales Family XIII bacterium]|jgi:pyruvate,water dikinase|nr:phosphoenolpyruvate synthase [Clostridiales Family XIII bacterium]